MKRNLLYLLLFGLLIAAACTAQTSSDTVAPPSATPLLADDQAVTTDSATGDSVPEIEHSGLTFIYDPGLLGETNIQDVPASADQGMFGAPTPAHTWIGFVPTGIQRDLANHWSLTREPQIIIFNINDFGSFALGDEMARTRVTSFQQMLTERPATFNDEIPVLPSINAAQMIRSQVRWLDFGSGMGVRFVTEYSQDNLPLINDRLMYVFYGMTSDGLHGVTAVFPLTNRYLPDIVQNSEDNDAPFSENYAAGRLATITEQVNALLEGDFEPALSQLDTLVQSITIAPTATDFSVVAGEPQHGQILAGADIFEAPVGGETIGTLATGEAVVVNGLSSDGRRSRILCLDGTTGNCWVDTDVVQINDLAEAPVLHSGGMPEVGQVVQITAVSDNPIYAEPSDKATRIGSLLFTGSSRRDKY